MIHTREASNFLAWLDEACTNTRLWTEGKVLKDLDTRVRKKEDAIKAIRRRRQRRMRRLESTQLTLDEVGGLFHTQTSPSE